MGLVSPFLDSISSNKKLLQKSNVPSWAQTEPKPSPLQQQVPAALSPQQDTGPRWWSYLKHNSSGWLNSSLSNVSQACPLLFTQEEPRRKGEKHEAFLHREGMRAKDEVSRAAMRRPKGLTQAPHIQSHPNPPGFSYTSSTVQLTYKWSRPCPCQLRRLDSGSRWHHHVKYWGFASEQPSQHYNKPWNSISEDLGILQHMLSS